MTEHAATEGNTLNGPPPSGVAPGSAHVGLWIQTKNGNVAHILTDPKLKQETVDALAEMIDAAAKAAADGTLFKAQNAEVSHE